MFGIDVIEFGYQKLNVLPPKVTAGGPAVENESNSRRPNKNNASSSNKDRSCCAWTTSEKSIHISSADTRTFLGGSHRSHCNKLNMGDDTRDHDNHYCATDEDDYWVDHMEHPDAHARPFDQLEREFVRDAPRTRVYIDGVQVTNFKRGFWRILKCFGWSHGARVLYMSTGDALAKSYTRGKKAVEAQFCCGALDKQSNSEYLFVQGRTHQDNRIDTKTGQVVLEKTFLLVRLEPYSVQEQWRLVKTFKVKTNTSVDEWTREWRRDKPIDGILSSVRTFPGEDSRLHDAENDKSFVARRFCGPRFDLLQDPAPTDVPIHTRPTSTTTVKAVADHENVTKNMFTNRTLTQSSSQSPSAAVCSGNSNTNRGSAYTVLFDGDNVRLDGDVVLTAVTWSSKGPSLYDDHQHDTDAIDHVSDPGMPHFDCDEERAGNDEHLNYHTSDPILVLSESASCV